jgi:hypothetical protein
LESDESMENKASKYRHGGGGHILFRHVGLLAYISAIASALKIDQKIEDVIPKIAKIEKNIEKKPWKGLFWESAKKRMITRKPSQKLDKNLILYIIGFDLSELKINEKKLKENYASLLNKYPGEITLPKKVN